MKYILLKYICIFILWFSLPFITHLFNIYYFDDSMLYLNCPNGTGSQPDGSFCIVDDFRNPLLYIVFISFPSIWYILITMAIMYKELEL